MAEPIASFSGLATGLDTGALINSLVAIERIPITRLEDKKKDIQSIQRRLTDIASELGNVNTILKKMDTRSEVLKAKAESSDTDKVEATVIAYPALLNHTMTVSQLATSEITISDGVSSDDGTGLFGTGTLTITVGAASGVDITVSAGDSLNSVADKINSAIDDAVAQVIYDGTDYHLQVIGSDTGTTNGAISFGESGTLTLNTDDPGNELVTAQNALFSINGHQMTRESNDVTGAVTGLSLKLKETTTSPITIEVERDNSALKTNIKDFVSKYNFLISLIDKESAYTGAARVGDSLAGDSTLRTLKDHLSRTIVDTNNDLTSTVYNRLSTLGVEITSTGALKFTETDLDAAIAADPDAVVEFFAGDVDAGIDGFAQIFDDLTTSYTRSDDGILTIRTDGIDDQVAEIDKQIDRLELRLDSYEESLRKEFAALETLVSGLQAQGNQMMAALGQT